MASNSKILNLTSGRRVKRNQAIGRVEHCVSAWVEEGVSIRDLSVAEMVAARSQQAREREPIAMAELPGIVFQQPASSHVSMHERAALIRAANELVAQAV